MARSSVESASVPQDLVGPPKDDRPWLAVRIFQLPGNLVADLLKATDDDDRMALRVLINMLFWNLAVVLVAILVFTQFG